MACLQWLLIEFSYSVPYLIVYANDGIDSGHAIGAIDSLYVNFVIDDV